MSSETENMLTVQEAALRLGVTEQAVYTAIKQNRLTATRRFGRLTVTQSQIESYRLLVGKKNGYHSRSTPFLDSQGSASEEQDANYWDDFIGIVRSGGTQGARNSHEVFGRGLEEKRRQGRL